MTGSRTTPGKPLFADAVASISLCVRLHVFDGCLTGIQSAFAAVRGTLTSRPRRSQDDNYGHAAAGAQAKVAYITHLLPITLVAQLERSIHRVRLSVTGR